MTPEEMQVLQRAVTLSEENNKILLSMRNAARWGRVWGFVKFVIIVGPLVWAYFYFQPFLNQIGTMYSQLQGIQGATQTQNKDLQDALKNIKQMDFKQFDLKSLNPDQIQNKK